MNIKTGEMKLQQRDFHLVECVEAALATGWGDGKGRSRGLSSTRSTSAACRVPVRNSSMSPTTCSMCLASFHIGATTEMRRIFSVRV